MSPGRRSILFLSGVAVLAMGLSVYLLDRDPATVRFLSGLGLVGRGGPRVFGALGGSLPSFLHTFAFLLMAAAVSSPIARQPAFPCLLAIGAEGAFEIGQHDAVAAKVAPFIPESMECLRSFLLQGTFGGADLLAIALGGTGAYLVIRPRGKGEETGE